MKNKIDPEIEITIPLKNFTYSGRNDVNNKNREFNSISRLEEKERSNFVGRLKEKERLLDHLIQGRNQGGSFLISGYRGAGKTRFVSEVLRNYKKRKGNFIEVKINLGNDGDLTSKVVLYNMVYLLNNALRYKLWVKFLQLLFGNFVRSFLFLAIIISGIFAGLIFSEPEIAELLQKFSSFDTRTLRHIFLFLSLS